MDAPIYLDHAATTPLAPEVADGLAERQRTLFGNPSSMHPAGRAAARALAEARETLAGALGARPENVVFTSGGTESLGMAVLGGGGDKPARVAISATEHSAVRNAAAFLKARRGWTLDEVPVDAAGRITPEALAAHVHADTRLVAVMLANNEIGTVSPVPALARVVRERAPRARIVVDAVQALGKIPVDVRALDADFVAVTAHKLEGPKGVGALWVRTPQALVPTFEGGGQESGLRGGTQPVPLIWAFAKAATLPRAPLAALRDRLWEALREAVPGITLTGAAPGPERLPHNLHVCVPGAPGEPLLNALAAAGVYASTGSACGAKAPFSRVLRAIGRRAEDGAYIRLSVGRSTTEAEVDEAARRFAAAVSTLRDVYGGTRK
jgi:cysteine desulfurase